MDHPANKVGVIHDGKRFHIRLPETLLPPKPMSWFVTAHFVRAIAYHFMGNETNAEFHIAIAEAHLHRAERSS